MAKMNKVVKYLAGFVFNSKGDQIESQTDAWKLEADCGCGIDCCNRKLVLTDKTNDEITSIHFEAGSLIVTTGDGTRYLATLTAE